MVAPSPEETIDRITNTIGNPNLAKDLYQSISFALKTPRVNLGEFTNAWQVFENSLNSAIYDIEKDKDRWDLFKRLLQYGPHDPSNPEAESGDERTVLSDPECGRCVDFIFSHMVNRFQGELGELLALESCIRLLEALNKRGQLTPGSTLIWGNMIREKQRIGMEWRAYAKGADGLVINARIGEERPDKLDILAVIEVKSMQLSTNRMLRQIEKHLNRLSGGLELGKISFESEKLNLEPAKVIKILVRPCTWKLPRAVKLEKNSEGVTTLIFPEPIIPEGVTTLVLPEPITSEVGTATEESNAKVWTVALSWSEDALRQAAFEMTYGYMAEIGKQYFPEEDGGYNAIKMRLYYLIHRIHYFYSKREHKITQKERKAIRLYNVYAFGYVLGADSRYMLWPMEGEHKSGAKEYEPVEMKPERDENGKLLPWWEGIERD